MHLPVAIVGAAILALPQAMPSETLACLYRTPRIQLLVYMPLKLEPGTLVQVGLSSLGQVQDRNLVKQSLL